MTSSAGGTTLDHVIASTSVLLLDFDGPVTPLMPDGIDRAIANSMRDVLRRLTGAVPSGVADTKDPLAVLRAAASEPADVLAAVEDACRAGEVDAAERSEPTAGAHEAMRACHEVGRPLIIVSNNAAEAIQAYLDRHELAELVLSIAARPHGRPDLMKPDPYLIREAFRQRPAPPNQFAFIGDSVTDVQVSRQTKVRSIGFAKNEARREQLHQARADVIIDRMSDLSHAIHRTNG